MKIMTHYDIIIIISKDLNSKDFSGKFCIHFYKWNDICCILHDY